MDGHTASDNRVVVRDTWPFRIFIAGLFVLLAASSLVRTFLAPSATGFLLTAAYCAAVAFISVGKPRVHAIATSDGITGLWVRVPRETRSSWFSRRRVASPLIPWNQVESIRTAATALSLSKIRVRLVDGREGEVVVSTVTPHGLRKIAAELEHARATAAAHGGSGVVTP
jgi:hypothetical protein